MALKDLFQMNGRSLSRIESLLQEQNSLLRELVAAHTGAVARTPKPIHLAVPLRIRTDKDVSRVTRQDVLEQEWKAQEAEVAPWRSGPDSDPTLTLVGGEPAPPKP